MPAVIPVPEWSIEVSKSRGLMAWIVAERKHMLLLDIRACDVKRTLEALRTCTREHPVQTYSGVAIYATFTSDTVVSKDGRTWSLDVRRLLKLLSFTLNQKPGRYRFIERPTTPIATEERNPTMSDRKKLMSTVAFCTTFGMCRKSASNAIAANEITNYGTPRRPLIDPDQAVAWVEKHDKKPSVIRARKAVNTRKMRAGMPSIPQPPELFTPELTASNPLVKFVLVLPATAHARLYEMFLRERDRGAQFSCV